MTSPESPAILYEHADGRRAVVSANRVATFAIDNPDWHRAGPVEIVWVDDPIRRPKRVQESLGEFLMDHGWSQRDMDTSDDFGAVLLAADPKAEPVPAGEYPPLPGASLWRDETGIRGYGTDPGTGPWYTADQLRAYADATCAMRAQAAPAAVASPLTKLQRKAIAVCFTSDKVSVSEVQRKLSISYADAQTLCQSIVDLGLTDELELAPSLKQRGAPATQAAPTSSASVEITDEQMHQGLAAAFAHPRAAAPDAVFKAGVDFGVSVALLQTAPTTQATPQPAVQQGDDPMRDKPRPSQPAAQRLGGRAA